MMNPNLVTYMIAEYDRQRFLRDAEQFRLAQVAQGRGRQALSSLAALLSALVAALHLG